MGRGKIGFADGIEKMKRVIRDQWQRTDNASRAEHTPFVV